MKETSANSETKILASSSKNGKLELKKLKEVVETEKEQKYFHSWLTVYSNSVSKYKLKISVWLVS